ncbi:hypothetical protein GCM10012275_64750 [Longimycelium tulufanense]|uniref:Uncharacterized protein n=1 Tax=Longimycelium tulufanense TaxID=907463 RepID=A0A8J3CL13_9PSEU|nr:hypothetical protein [Longimycelium tulufanense]GGM85031.1 hypothetical protein GCM10012275_64750 [Longimycelium tulufanense]
MSTGKQLRDRGFAEVTAADRAVHRNVGERIKAAIDQLLAEGGEWTAEDVRARLPEGVEPHSPNLLGAIIGNYASRGLIRRVDLRTSRRPSRHAAEIKVWAGTRGDEERVA